jgi:Galactose oxidase, central domain/Kelch motif
MKTHTPVTSRIQTITLSLGRGPLQDALCRRATMLCGRLALPLFFLGAALLVQPCAAAPFQWAFTGSLNTAREYQAATLLSDGRVLVAGGGAPSAGDFPLPRIKTAELYNPATGTWTFTGSLNDARLLQTQTLLPNGKVLAAGGWPEGTSTGTAELYDPATGTWTFTGDLNVRRAAHTATLLLDGRVLAVGGSHSIQSAELYDPATGHWTLTGSPNVSRFGYHTATLLPDGRVLVVGGRYNVATAELYDPATGTFTVTGSLHAGRSDHTATLLPNGKVLVAGGLNRGLGVLASAELYDPATGNWTPTGSLNVARWRCYQAILLSDGRVLMAGGQGGHSFNSSLTSAELYDPATGTWAVTGSLNTSRSLHTTTLLSNGNVLVAGGNNHGSVIASAELFQGPLQQAGK